MKILDYPRSGSYQGVTSSRNRNGQYVRSRAVPVNPGTTFQQSVRSRLSLNAEAWRALTGTQRDGWTALGLYFTRTDSLGQTYNLTGFQAYCSVNNNRLAAGDAVISDAGVYTPPAPLASITPTITSSSYSVAYTATPLPASTRAFISASPQRSAGRTYEGDFRLMSVTAAAAASPANILAAYQARFGNPVTGARIFTSIQTYFAGYLSTPIITSTIVA